MYRSLVRLSFCLFLVSLILPMNVDLALREGEYLPGIALFSCGFAALFDQGSNPLIFLTWLTNAVLLVTYSRSFFLGRRTNRWLIGLSITIIILTAFTDPNFGLKDIKHLLNSHAFWLWFSAHLCLLVAAFLPREKAEDPNTLRYFVNGRREQLPKLLSLGDVITQSSSPPHELLKLEFGGQSSLQVNVRKGFVEVWYRRSGVKTHLWAQGPPPPEVPPAKDAKVSHEDAVSILRHFARTGEPHPNFHWAERGLHKVIQTPELAPQL